MSEPIADTPSAAPRWKPLDARQRRVLGVLIEKAKTTPAAYPMSVNAIVTGCNQKNNRDPLTSLDDIDVEKALDQLRTLGVVSEIDWLGRVSKYKHHAYEWLGVSKPEIAVMTELLLRGAQALGELRGRAARMEPIADLAALKPIVEGLLGRGLMVELTPPGRGQLVSHNLYLPEELAELKSQVAGHAPRAAASAEEGEGSERAAAPPDVRTAPPPRAAAESGPRGTPSESVAALSARVSELSEELASLRERVSNLESRLG
jgi:uncharacterized protein YceH (UPF0502 family)